MRHRSLADGSAPLAPRKVLLALALIAACGLAYLSRSSSRQSQSLACVQYESGFRTRHMRRHRAHTLAMFLRQPQQADVLSKMVEEARCLLAIRTDIALSDSVDYASKIILSSNVSVVLPARRLADSTSSASAPGSASRRITRGLGLFAGADFDCPSHRDAFLNAPWSRGACLLKCLPTSTAARPQCSHAVEVCNSMTLTLVKLFRCALGACLYKREIFNPCQSTCLLTYAPMHADLPEPGGVYHYRHQRGRLHCHAEAGD